MKFAIDKAYYTPNFIKRGGQLAHLIILEKNFQFSLILMLIFVPVRIPVTSSA